MSGGVLALALALSAGAKEPVVVFRPSPPAASGSEWIGAMAAEMLPRALQRAGVPAVVDSDRRRVQDALGVSAGTPTRATSIRVAEALGASRAIVGAWEEPRAGVTLSLRVLDAARGSLSAPFVASGALEDVSRLLHALAWDIALAGPQPPSARREDLLRYAASLPYPALRSLGECLAARDAGARLAKARLAAAQHPGFEEATLVLAHLLLDAGSFAEARATLARVPASSVFAREARFLDGVALVGLGRYREADTLYADLARSSPSASVLSNRAVARLRLGGSAKGASTLLRQAVESEPAAVDPPVNLGFALLVEGDAAAAAFWLRGAARRQPGDAQVRLMLSWALSAIGRRDEAEEQRRAAIALAPALEAMSNADFSRRLERVALSERSLLIDPERREDAEEARTHAARGETLLEARDLAGAVSELARAALLDPYSARSHVGLARARLAQGDTRKAVDELRMALWCREDPTVRRELSTLLDALGRSEEARRVQQ